ncbi:MAG: glycosyltransferase, partial [Pseudomonadota bacterium]
MTIATAPSLAGRKILLFISEDWVFCSHRLPIGVALKEAGADVVIVTRVRDHAEPILNAGLTLRPLELDRSGANPLRDRKTVSALMRIYREEKPDLVHNVAIKPILYGAYCAWRCRVPAVVNALTGMGSLFLANSLSARSMRPAVRQALRFLLNRRNSHTILQNNDDVALLVQEFGVAADRIALIRGAGVDTAHFHPTPEPAGTPIAVCVSRMLRDKGIVELVDAVAVQQPRRLD